MAFNIDKKFSEAISSPLVTAYQKGGLGLAFLVLGAILLLASAFLDRANPLLWVLAGTGFLLILTVVALFYFQAIRPIQSAQDAVSSNAEAIDAVQRAAVQMTEVAYLLQATAFKHAETIREIIAIATQKVREIPVVGPPTSAVLQRVLEKYSPTVVGLTEETKAVIEEIGTSLARADAKQLNTYIGKLDQVRNGLSLALKGIADA